MKTPAYPVGSVGDHALLQLDLRVQHVLQVLAQPPVLVQGLTESRLRAGQPANNYRILVF